MTRRAQLHTTPERLKTLQSVLHHLEEAHRILTELRPTERSGDVGYFADELAEFLSCDDGECGYKAFMELWKAPV